MVAKVLGCPWFVCRYMRAYPLYTHYIYYNNNLPEWKLVKPIASQFKIIQHWIKQKFPLTACKTNSFSNLWHNLLKKIEFDLIHFQTIWITKQFPLTMNTVVMLTVFNMNFYPRCASKPSSKPNPVQNQTQQS